MGERRSSAIMFAVAYLALVVGLFLALGKHNYILRVNCDALRRTGF